jgi:hypothetical protein
MPDPKQQRELETTRGFSRGGFAVWQYTGGTWVLRKTACEEGYECGSPPSERGQYEGEMRKTACVRRAAGK